MIINSISLHNFMSYADINLDLTSVDVACLSGGNGAGKSALLDAITWALWERARASSDELIRIGEKELWVDLIFSYENRTYRIRRSRQRKLSKKGGKATSKGTLEFQVLQDIQAADSDKSLPAVTALQIQSSEALPPLMSQVNQVVASRPALSTNKQASWKSLTGGSMRATQQVINDLLRMEYDTFINSAYLRQGKADEFTTRAPNERKQVLSEILGLSYFERLKDSCRIKTRESKGKIELLEEYVKELPDVEKEREDLTSRLVEARSCFKQFDSKKLDLDATIKEKHAQHQNLQFAARKKEANQEKIAELTSDQEELKRRYQVSAIKLKAIEKLIGESGHIEEQSKKFAQIRTLTEKLDLKSLNIQELNDKKHELKSKLATMRSRLEVEADHAQTRLKEVLARVEKLDSDTADRDKINASYDEYLKLLESEAQASSKQEAFSQLNRRATELGSAITEAKIKLEAEVEQRSTSLKDLNEILMSESSLIENKTALEEAASEMDKYETELELVESRGLEIKSQIEAQEVRIVDLKHRIKENLERVKELHDHDHTSICPLCSAPIVDRSKVIGRYEIQNQAYEQEILETDVFIKGLEETRLDLRDEYKRLRKLLESRKDLDKQIGQYNEKSSSVERARLSYQALKSELESLEKRLKDNDFAQVEMESLINIKAEVHKLEFDPVMHSNLQSQIRMKRHIESRKQNLDRDLSELEKALKLIPELEEKSKDLTDKLEAESYGQEVRQELKELNEKLANLDYDRVEHMRLKKELNELLPFAEQLNELSRAKDDLPELVKLMEDIDIKIEAKELKIKELSLESKLLVEESTKLPELDAQLSDLEVELKELCQKRDAVSNDVAVLESQCEEIEKTIGGLKAKRDELASLKNEREDYSLLAEAFGKKGIQAIIIENAIPEIESEANRILSRLSDNKMHIALVTQHKTKSGSMTETLDILIGDEVGTRNYELYSGGESFKVNFAIRIALSRLLARRAGARLETLIIDEGFGSQDDRSRERLVRAIRSIQPDFSRILVITHITDVREMFPTQIQVSKENGISRLQIVS